MKPVHKILFFVMGISMLTGCSSGGPAQASTEQAAQFKGGPMPADAQKKMQESLQHSREIAQQKASAGGQK